MHISIDVTIQFGPEDFPETRIAEASEIALDLDADVISRAQEHSDQLHVTFFGKSVEFAANRAEAILHRMRPRQ